MGPMRIRVVGMRVVLNRMALLSILIGCLTVLLSARGMAMSEYLWKNRPLVVFAPSDQDQLLVAQKQIVQSSRAGFVERDMVVIFVSGDGAQTVLGPDPGQSAQTLRQRFGVASGQFRSILVGKDGGVKLASSSPIAAEQLFRLIDSMPMRRQEMRAKKR